MSPDIKELVDLYAADRPGLSRHTIAAFIEAGKEPPTQEHVAMLGFDAADRKVLNNYRTKHDPYGTRAQAAEEA